MSTKNKENLNKLEDIVFKSAKYADDELDFKLSLWYQLMTGTSVGLDDFIKLRHTKFNKEL